MINIKRAGPIKLLLAAGGCVLVVGSASQASPDRRIVNCAALSLQIQQLQTNVNTLQDLVNNTYPNLVSNIQSQITTAQETNTSILNGGIAFLQVVGGNQQAVNTAISMLPADLQSLARSYDQARRTGSPLAGQYQQLYFNSSDRMRNSLTAHIAALTGTLTKARTDAASASSSLNTQSQQLSYSNGLYSTYCGPNPRLPNMRSD